MLMVVLLNRAPLNAHFLFNIDAFDSDQTPHERPLNARSICYCGFRGEAKRAPGPARAQGSQTRQCLMSWGRSLIAALRPRPVRSSLATLTGMPVNVACAPGGGLPAGRIALRKTARTHPAAGFSRCEEVSHQRLDR